MTLVVAGIEDSRITIVADSKLTFVDSSTGAVDEAETRKTYFNAMPKIMLLRRDLAVGITSEDAPPAIERLVCVRDLPVDDVLHHLSGEDESRFVVAALDPPRLWRVHGPTVQERGEVRTWVGDPAAYEVFQARMGDFDDAELSFRLMTSMQWLTSFSPVASVGGIMHMLVTGADGFQFAPNVSTVGPDRMEVAAAAHADGVTRMRFEVPDGVDPSGHSYFVIPGTDPTRGAVAMFIPQTGRGLVFPHDRPWQAIVVPAQTLGELVDAAQAAGTSLSTPAMPPGFPVL